MYQESKHSTPLDDQTDIDGLVRIVVDETDRVFAASLASGRLAPQWPVMSGYSNVGTVCSTRNLL
jgi:hypothetical protein